MANEIKAGDVVELKGGSPLLTVELIDTHGGTAKARCLWFEGGAIRDALIATSALKPHVPSDY